MEKKVIKLLVATDNKDTKILLDLGNGNFMKENKG